ncbi:S41 family peptidase [Puia sp.]|uniref:S41 family peptidase n=1 Tax=Puia sp. TaxID=2045100 RepID=UPI002F3F7DB3
MTRSFSLLLLLCCVLAAREGVANDSLPRPCMQKAEKLLDEVLGFMQKTYYRRDRVSWPDLTTKAREQLRNAGNCEDAYASISWCFKELNEHHSFVMPPDKAARYIGDEDADAPSDLSQLVGEIRGEWLQDSIGYLTIPWVSTDDSLICQRIADSLQHVIARLDTRGISRWIIDLRKNSGGNCWPMLTGLGPLLGDGVYGYFVASGERIPISYRDGSAIQGRHVRCRVSHTGYHPRHEHPSIVVLTGRRTVSAGEIVALAFRGREQTCLMGEPTAGLTTANATYSLSDRSMLVLSVCQEADRTGTICEGSIQPDKLVAAGNIPAPGQDPARAAAINWLMTK